MTHPFALVHDIFLSPGKQIARVRRLNLKRKWGFTDKDFRQAETSIPKWPEDKLVAVTLVPYLDDEKMCKRIKRTFRELWEVAASAQHASWIRGGNTDSDPLRLLKGATHQPGLRWEVIDLGCNRSQPPVEIRSSKSSPHAGILAAAMLHPEWVKHMDGDNVPYVWLPGYEANVADRHPWKDVPTLSFVREDCRIESSCGWYDDGRVGWAVPSFVRQK